MPRRFKELASLLVCRIGALGRIRRIRKCLLGRPALFILCYHRVADEAPILSPQCVTPAQFEDHVRVLRRHFDVWPFDRVTGYLNGSLRLKRDTVIFTFDDGYADNFRNALPVLRKHDIRAAFFISSAPLLRKEPYWIDRLGNILAGLSAERFDRLPLHDPETTRLLGECVRSNAPEKEAIARRLCRRLKTFSESDRETFLSLLEFAADAAPLSMDGASRVMSPEQIAVLLEEGHVVGAHTVSHPVLSGLPLERCREEIARSIRELEEQFRDAVRCFAYPFGEVGDCAGPAREILSENGILLAVTTEERPVSPGDDPLMLPRKVISGQPIGSLLVRLERLAWTR